MSEAGLDRFNRSTFSFLEELQANNNRDWFAANKDRYHRDVVAPALAFIDEMQPRLLGIAPSFLAVGKKNGGSLMRIYRDTRFSKDKTPYKTNVGIHFRHRRGKDVHAPGFYIHIAPDESFVGAGIWHPEPSTLGLLREAIDAHPRNWLKARDDRQFQGMFRLIGDSLKQPPRGYRPEHPLIDDLKRKDFIGVHGISRRTVLRKGFVDDVERVFLASRPFMRFLCQALDLDW